MLAIRSFDSLPRFKSDYKHLPAEIQTQTKEAIEKLLKACSPPFPKSLRFEKLEGYRNPNIYTIHVTPNHSHKASFELRGDVAVFRQVATHKEIDRNP